VKVGDLIQHKWFGSGESPYTLFIGIIVKVYSNVENLDSYEIKWLDNRRKPDTIIYEEGELNLVSNR